jgi:Fe-S oxidoreductase
VLLREAAMANLADFRYTMESCNHCGQCKWILPAKMKGWDFASICPLHEYHGFDAYSGQGLVQIAKERLDGKLDYGDGLETLLHTCTACGACDLNCKSVRDMEVLDTIYALREDCAKAGYLPEPLRRTAENVEETHNIYGEPHAERFSWLPPDFKNDTEADTALFVGCSAYRHPEIPLAAIRILRAGGVKFKLLYEDEWCCGASLWRSGQREAAEKLISRNVDTFHRHGIKTLITACAECFGAFCGGYPRFSDTGGLEFRHISQVAAKLIAKGSLPLKKGENPLRVAYHDPCMLGRLSEKYVPWNGKIRPFGLHVPEKQWRRGEHGVYEEPRAVLRALEGVTLCEMTRNFEQALCCGANARDVDAEFAAWTAAERRREAKASGAEAVVSCCPFCQDALGGEGENPLPYLDLAVLLADRLREEA